MATDSSTVAVVRPPRRLAAGAVAAATTFAVFAMMARSGHHALAGVPLGCALVAVAAFALAVAIVVLPSDPTSAATRVVSAGVLRRPLLGVGSSFAALTGGLAAAQAGVLLPQWAWGWFIAAACIALAASGFTVAEAIGVTSSDPGTEGHRPLWKHEGFGSSPSRRCSTSRGSGCRRCGTPGRPITARSPARYFRATIGSARGGRTRGSSSASRRSTCGFRRSRWPPWASTFSRTGSWLVTARCRRCIPSGRCGRRSFSSRSWRPTCSTRAWLRRSAAAPPCSARSS